MVIGNLKLRGQVLAAPLAGVSNRPFRVLALESGAALVVTEMISSEGVIRRQKRTMEMMAFQDDERPIAIQLFGANPEVMGAAARITAAEFKPDLIDINFGCPVKKVVNKNGGAAVLKDLNLTREIVEAIVEGAGEIPVTVKMRTGWDNKSPVYVEAGTISQKAGAAALILHARSRSVAYSGKADWTAIRTLKDAVDIPVVGNGDIRTPEDARRMLDETGCDAVMIGRASLGNPFIFRTADEYLKTGVLPGEPGIRDKISMALRHAELMVEQYGEVSGVKKMRRYLGWYVRGFPGATDLRPKLFKVDVLPDIRKVLQDYCSERGLAL
jgi:tRNA-dihydrouridine synthase B